MRWLSIILLGIVLACSSAPPDPVPLVRLAPIGPYVCANTTMQGQPARIVTLFVVQPYGEDELVVVQMTNGRKYQMETRALVVPLGVGQHRFEVWVGERHFIRTLTVYNCVKGKR